MPGLQHWEKFWEWNFHTGGGWGVSSTENIYLHHGHSIAFFWAFSQAFLKATVVAAGTIQLAL